MCELLTENRRDLPGALPQYLATTKLFACSGNGVRQKARRVTNWKNDSMALH